MKRGKRYQEIAKLVDRTVSYEPAKALELATQTGTAKLCTRATYRFRPGRTRSMLRR